MGKTVAKLFQETARRHAERPACKAKVDGVYQPTSYGELYQRVREIGTGLQEMGIGAGDKVGLVCDNRPEWILCDLSIVCIGAADVPRGGDSTVQELDYILSHSDAVAAFVENGRQLEKVLSLRERLPNIRFLVVMDPGFEGAADEDVHRLEDIALRGRARLEQDDTGFESAIDGIADTDLATIIYTSGTTGDPKGVMLSHRNIMQNLEVLPDLLGVTMEDRFLSILPPWHVFERIVEYLSIAVGASQAYTGIRTFADDMALEKPTFIASVPRIWEGIYTKVMAKIGSDPPAKQKVFHFLLSSSKRYVKARKVLQGQDAVFQDEGGGRRLASRMQARFTVSTLAPVYRFAQKKFTPIRGRTGGKLRAAISGGGALPPYVDEFFAAVGITLLEGYGLTETSPVLAVRTFERQVIGTVGPPLPGTQIKVIDEKGESLPPGEKGLIKCKGGQVMEGYYKKEEETARVIDSEGWFDTGDLGRFTVRGELSITGRAKETIVLLGGENVEPTPLEDAITESRYIAQAMLVGQDRKNLGILIVPAFDTLRERGGLGEKSNEELCEDRSVLSLIRDELRRLVNTERGFKSYERVSHLHLLPLEFTPGEELTHTMKKKRNVIMERYAEVIDRMYV